MFSERNRGLLCIVLFSLLVFLPALSGLATEGAFWQCLVWAAICSIMTVQLMESFHYFDGSWRFSFISDFVSISLALAIPAILAKILIAATFGYGAYQYRQLPILIVGCAAMAAFAQKMILRFAQGRQRWRVYLKISLSERWEVLRELNALGLLERIHFLEEQELQVLLARKESVDLVVISRAAVTQFQNNAELLSAYSLGATVIDWRDLLQSIRLKVDIQKGDVWEGDVWAFLMSAERQTPMRRAYLRFKLMCEPILAFCFLIALAPVLFFVALAIKIFMPGPVFYRQIRTGYRGRRFALLKFRSMKLDAEESGPKWADKTDPRVTALGRILRATHLDELPQLWNVLKGDLGFIGPRPERPEFYERLVKEIPLFYLRTAVRPGITGWAQVQAGYAASVEESQLKLEHDLYYIQKASPQLDFIIILKTVGAALLGRGGVAASLALRQGRAMDTEREAV